VDGADGVEPAPCPDEAEPAAEPAVESPDEDDDGAFATEPIIAGSGAGSAPPDSVWSR